MLLVCRLLWAQFIFFAYLALYLLYSIGVWAIVCVIFNIASMTYWELKGLGVHAFFANKVIPADLPQ